MIKCKIVSSYSSSEVEYIINTFFINNKVKLIDIKYSFIKGNYSAMIIYETNE